MDRNAKFHAFIDAQRAALARVQNYGYYWNAIGNYTDIRQRTGAVTNAFHEITQSLKEARLLMLAVQSAPIGGYSDPEYRKLYHRIDTINDRLNLAWVWMTHDVEQSMSCFDEDWVAPAKC